MPRISDIRRIIPEDFSQEDQEVAEKISGSYNEFADEVRDIINGGIDFDNLTRRKVTIDLNIGENSSITGNRTIVTNLSFVSMIHVGKVDSLVNTTLRPVAAPFIGFTYKGNGQVVIDYVGGLPAGRWRLTLEIIQ